MFREYQLDSRNIDLDVGFNLLQTSPCGASPRLDEAFRQRTEVGVWLTNSPSPLYYSRSQIRSAMARLKKSGFTRVVPNVRSRGTTFHRSRFAPTEPPLIQAVVGIDPICTLATEGRKRGIKVMPWFEYGLMKPADSAVDLANPEWVLTRADGQRRMTLTETTGWHGSIQPIPKCENDS